MLHDFMAIFFPEQCKTCGTGLVSNEKYICMRCYSRLPRFRDPLDLKDCLPNIMDAHIYKDVFSFMKYYKKGIAQKFLQQVKYGNCPQLAETTGKWLGESILKIHTIGLPDLIIPVPLHPRRQRKRGYNQSAYFAIGLSRAMGIPWSGKHLIRSVDNPTQTDKSRLERIQNVSGVFQIKQSGTLRNKHILLADDVITTGATLKACAETLDKAGVKEVAIASIAIAK